MHCARNYEWLHPGAEVTAESVPSARHANGQLAFWRAATPVEVALKAKTGPSKIAVHVHANHGRWIVECPDDGDAQLAVRDDRRFMCVTCANASVGGLWRPVVWPKDHAVIEELLDVRPHPAHRNYRPGETASELRRENAIHEAELLPVEPEWTEKPEDMRRHAIWAGLSPEGADEWVRECHEAKAWLEAVEKAERKAAKR